MVKCFFLESLPRSASARAQELQKADARKHAATVAHARKRTDKTPRLSRLRYNRPTPRWEFSKGEDASLDGLINDGWEDVGDAVSDDSGTSQRTRERSTQNASITFEFDDTPNETAEDHAQNESDEDALQRLSETWHRDFSNLIRVVNQVEPFYRSPHGHTSSFYRGCEYFMEVIIPNNAPVYTIFNVSNVYTQHTFDLTQKDHFLHVWLGAMLLLKSATAPETSSSQDACRHTGMALSRLRRAISDRNHSTDDYLISSVLFLALLARAYGDTQGFQVHCKNLVLLVKQMGGLDGLGHTGLLKACVLQWASFWDVDRTRTIFPEHRPTKAPLYPERPMSLSLRQKTSRLPLGFGQLAHSYLLPLDLMEILSRVAEYHSPAKRMELLREQNSTWYQRKNVDFWDACTSLAIPGPDFNKFLCLTLLLYTVNEFSPVRRGVKGMTVYSAPRMLLAKQIHLLEPTITEQSEKDCWIWMWMVIVDSWSERGCLTPTGNMVLLQFRKQFPYIEDWSQLDFVLSKFFYSEKFNAACRKYWEISSEAEAMPV